jgi:hypothetical protein
MPKGGTVNIMQQNSMKIPIRRLSKLLVWNNRVAWLTRWVDGHVTNLETESHEGPLIFLLIRNNSRALKRYKDQLPSRIWKKTHETVSFIVSPDSANFMDHTYCLSRATHGNVCLWGLLVEQDPKKVCKIIMEL